MQEGVQTGFCLFPGTPVMFRLFLTPGVKLQVVFSLRAQAIMGAQGSFCLSPVVFWPLQIPCG